MGKTYLIIDEEGKGIGSATVGNGITLNVPPERLVDLSDFPEEQRFKIIANPKDYDRTVTPDR